MKALLITILLSISIASWSQDVIKTSGIFETGYENRRVGIMTPPSLSYVGSMVWYDLNPFYGILYLDAQYKGFKLYTQNKSYFNKDFSVYFNPLQIEYRIGCSYNTKNFTFICEHMCSHGVEQKIFFESINRIGVNIKLF